MENFPAQVDLTPLVTVCFAKCATFRNKLS